jgi:hypothetical protein
MRKREFGVAQCARSGVLRAIVSLWLPETGRHDRGRVPCSASCHVSDRASAIDRRLGGTCPTDPDPICDPEYHTTRAAKDISSHGRPDVDVTDNECVRRATISRHLAAVRWGRYPCRGSAGTWMITDQEC